MIASDEEGAEGLLKQVSIKFKSLKTQILRILQAKYSKLVNPTHIPMVTDIIKNINAIIIKINMMMMIMTIHTLLNNSD